MGAYKGDEARYAVVSMRASDRELKRIDDFAGERGLSRTTAMRMLVQVGIECIRQMGDADAA